jgi:hypothetical protein
MSYIWEGNEMSMGISTLDDIGASHTNNGISADVSKMAVPGFNVRDAMGKKG